MATRSSGSSTRSKKSPAQSLPPVINLPDESHSDDADTEARAANGVVDEAPGEVQITQSKLEQREIPSFSESREARIAERAYWRAERRGFAPGQELEDWLHAEKDVDSDGSSK
jgi:hypothetical protein